MVIESGIKIQEIREETTRRNLTCIFVKVIVGVFGQIAHTALLLPYLYRENRCRTIANSLVGGLQYLTNNAAPFFRSIGAVIDGAEHNLISSS